MDEWLIWLVLAVVLATVEAVSLTMALGVLGGAALVTAGVAAAGLPLVAQLLVFATSAVAGVVLIRPVALRHLRGPSLARFGVEALVGKRAVVVEDVTGVAGQVRIDGEQWSARAYDDTLVIPAGSIADVLAIRGNTALVYPQEGPWTSR